MLSICTFDLGRFAITVDVPPRLTFEPIPDIPHTQFRWANGLFSDANSPLPVLIIGSHRLEVVGDRS